MIKPMMLSAALAAAGLTGGTAEAAKPKPVKATVTAPAPLPEGQAPMAAPAGGYPYLRFIPKGYNDDTSARWPVIIFLHGSGERGTDIELVKVHGPPKLVANDPAFPFIVLSPQLPADQKWDPASLDAILDTAMRDLRIDPARVYLTGLSLGGMGTWSWAAARPDRFAALAPVAGRADPATACAIKDIPEWIFHGDADNVVSPAGSYDMAKALEACGAKPRLTLYPATGHDSWTATYNNAELYLWFLRQRKAITPQEPK